MDPAPAPTAPRRLPAIDRFLTQLSHRLLTLAVWTLAARVALGFFDYDPGVTGKLLPVAMIALNAALVCAFSAYWLCRLARLPTDESRALLSPTLCLIAVTALWMAAAIVAR